MLNSTMPLEVTLSSSSTVTASNVTDSTEATLCSSTLSAPSVTSLLCYLDDEFYNRMWYVAMAELRHVLGLLDDELDAFDVYLDQIVYLSGCDAAIMSLRMGKAKSDLRSVQEYVSRQLMGDNIVEDRNKVAGNITDWLTNYTTRMMRLNDACNEWLLDKPDSYIDDNNEHWRNVRKARKVVNKTNELIYAVCCCKVISVEAKPSGTTITFKGHFDSLETLKLVHSSDSVDNLSPRQDYSVGTYFVS